MITRKTFFKRFSWAFFLLLGFLGNMILMSYKPQDAPQGGMPGENGIDQATAIEWIKNYQSVDNIRRLQGANQNAYIDTRKVYFDISVQELAALNSAAATISSSLQASQMRIYFASKSNTGQHDAFLIVGVDQNAANPIELADAVVEVSKNAGGLPCPRSCDIAYTTLAMGALK